MTVYTKPKKYIYSVIILTGILLFQEILARLIFPMPEVLNFNRIKYSPHHWIGNKTDGNVKHPAIMNKVFLAESAMDRVKHKHTTNIYGFRDKVWANLKKNKPRILFVGDSFVEGMMAPDNKTIPYIFRNLIKLYNNKWEVFNLGVNAANIEEYVYLIKDAIPIFKPKEIIIVFFANDFNKIKPFSSKKMNNITKVKYNSFYIPRLFQVINRIINQQTICLSWQSKPQPFFEPVPNPANPWTFNKEKYSYFVSERIAEAMQHGKFNPWLVNKLNIIADKYKKIDTDIKHYIIHIHNLSVINNINLSIVYIPEAVMVSDYYLDYWSEYAHPRRPISMTDKKYKLQAKYLRKLTNQFNIPFLDLTPFLFLIESENNHMYWKYDMHMNPKGYNYSSNKIFKWWYTRNKSGKKSNKVIEITEYIDGFDNWFTFVDQSGRGSKIDRIDESNTENGNLEITMVKAANPSKKDNNKDYPYVGLATNFRHNGSPVDLSNSEKIILIYKLKGPLDMILTQADIPLGEEFRVSLEQTDKYRKAIITWDEFHQPYWVEHKQILNLSKVTGIKFQVTSPERNQATLGLRSILLPKQGKQIYNDILL